VTALYGLFAESDTSPCKTRLTKCEPRVDGMSMELDAAPGASVFLIISGRAAPLVFNGTLVNVDGGRIVVDLEDPSSCTPQEPEADDLVPVSLADRRGVARYPTWLDATIYSGSYPSGHPAVVTDLSMDGASVEVDEWNGDPFYRLVLDINGETLQIECECVHYESTWRGVLLHTRFVLLSREQHEVLEAVVAALRSVFGQAQVNLIRQHSGPSVR
jgi:hypothetical protein